MINPEGERELAYLVKIDNILPIEGADRVEIAVVGGWHIMVHKEEFHIGDIAVYFEIDSKVPEREPFMFLESKHFKIKTQKYFHGTVLSQGLLMSLNDFTIEGKEPQWVSKIKENIAKGENVEHTFLTKELGITYGIVEDNKRKSKSIDKYQKMMQRNPKIFNHSCAKWMMKRDWGKRIMFFFFGSNNDEKRGWPSFIPKTDEERIQNIPWQLEDKGRWIATEKIDGSSTTAAWKRTGFRKHQFYICSRNVVFDKPDSECYYETNIYTEMAEKYEFEAVLEDIANQYKLDWVILQGETYGKGVQKNNYGMSEHDFAGFNLIFSTKGRLPSLQAKSIMEEWYGIPWVPIVDNNFILPDTVDELLEKASGESKIDGKMREGLVFRSLDGARSFKAVSNDYLLKYHQ